MRKSLRHRTHSSNWRLSGCHYEESILASVTGRTIVLCLESSHCFCVSEIIFLSSSPLDLTLSSVCSRSMILENYTAISATYWSTVIISWVMPWRCEARAMEIKCLIRTEKTWFMRHRQRAQHSWLSRRQQSEISVKVAKTLFAKTSFIGYASTRFTRRAEIFQTNEKEVRPAQKEKETARRRRKRKKMG